MQFYSLAGSEIMRTAYGIDVLPEDDPYVVTAEAALQALAASTNAGAYLVDTLPICEHLSYPLYHGDYFVALYIQ